MHAFLFDLDDTLFDHRHSTREALAVIRERLAPLAALTADVLEEQHSIVLEELHQRVLAGELDVDAARIERFRRLVEMHGGTSRAHDIEAAARAYRSAYVASRRAVTGAAHALEALRPHGRIGIISNNVTAEQLEKMAACGLDRLVDAVVISEAVGVAKPAPEIFGIALARLGADPADAVMIGDSWTADVCGARAAGIRAIWFNPLGRLCPDATLVAAEIHAWEPAADVVKTILSAYEKETVR
jgi:HAD superfamily hydrolase (TIGR01549 family)